MEMKDDSSVTEANIERAKAVFSKYYEYLPYKREHRESVLSVLYSRETGTSSTYCYKTSKMKWASSTRKGQCFYMRSLCAAKFGSSVQPLSYPITNISETTREVDRMLRPRQFEYHPSDSSLMAVGTLDGEVVVLNHETGSIRSCIIPSLSMNSILGLCWLKHQPSKNHCNGASLYGFHSLFCIKHKLNEVIAERSVLQYAYLAPGGIR